MGYIDIGKKRYKVDAFGEVIFRITGFKNIDIDIIEEVLIDFRNLIVKASELIKEENATRNFNEKLIKFDITQGDTYHDNTSQKIYLKETRNYWEEKYSIEELIWLFSFGYFVSEISEICGKLGDEWYRLYEMVRGDLPDNFPKDISFNIMIENVCDRKIYKYINKTIKDYFHEYPQAIKKLREWKIPDNLILWQEIGLTVEEYVKQAEYFKSSNPIKMEL